MYKQTRMITFTAVLAALAVLTNLYDIPLGVSNRLSLVYLPSFIAGIFMGPVHGFVVGALGDIIGQLIMPKGTWIPTITLASGLIGLIPGMVFRYMKFLRSNWLKLSISFLGCFIICTCIINTASIWWIALNGSSSKYDSFFAYLLARVPIQLAVIGVNYIVMLALVEIKPVYKSILNAINPYQQSADA